MNLNMDIKDLTWSQIVLLVVGAVVFCGLLFFLATYGYVVTMALIGLAVFFVGRWYLAGRNR
jgi:hypothetical protein